VEKQKILVVDDDPRTTKSLKRALEATGVYKVQTINQAPEAYDACKAFRPDLVLLDVMMPEMDGGEVAALIQEDEKLKDIPIVYLTGILAADEVSATGQTIAGRTYLAKPIKNVDLIACIENELA